MAQRKPIVIDGLVTEVREKSTLADVVPVDVTSVLTSDGQLVPREHFRRVPVPDGFETNLSPINKGAVVQLAQGRKRTKEAKAMGDG